MKTSRIEGILVFDTTKPYNMAIDGNLEDRNQIICHDVNSKCENAAFDIEQLLTVGLMEMSASKTAEKMSEKGGTAEKELETEDFFKKECPTDKEIDEIAMLLKTAFSMSKEIKMSEIIEAFNAFRKAGVICAAGDIKMTDIIWNTVSRQDKLKIIFRYCSFFVNPLEALQTMA